MACQSEIKKKGLKHYKSITDLPNILHQEQLLGPRISQIEICRDEPTLDQMAEAGQTSDQTVLTFPIEEQRASTPALKDLPFYSYQKISNP